MYMGDMSLFYKKPFQTDTLLTKANRYRIRIGDLFYHLQRNCQIQNMIKLCACFLTNI